MHKKIQEHTELIFDTHAHLDFDEFSGDREEVLRKADLTGVKLILVPGVDIESSKRAIDLSEKYWNVYCSVGVHPNSIGNVKGNWLEEIVRLSNHPKVVAIGEIGLDFYRNVSSKETQLQSFRSLLSVAKDNGLPVIVHIRNAHDDAMIVMEEVGYFRGVLHSFSGDERFLSWALKKGFYVGLGGPVTYKNFGKIDIVKKIPLNRLVLETDSPYLSPHPYRGKRNEPSMVGLVCERIAQIYGEAREKIARVTTRNACSLFGLPVPWQERTRKSLGQSYISNYRICKRISSCIGKGNVCLEIGSGKGQLTRFIVDKFNRIYCVDIDYENAMETSKVSSNIVVLNKNILSVNLSKMSRFLGERFAVVGNIPYSITTQILLHLLEHKDSFPKAVIMVQKEYAQRLLSEPGCPQYGILTAVIKNLFEVRKLFDVAPENFRPVPAVWSSVIELVPRETALCKDVPPAIFAQIARAVMAHRRKTILNSLLNKLPDYPWDDILSRIGIDTSIRGEKLSMDQLCLLASAYYETLKTKDCGGRI